MAKSHLKAHIAYFLYENILDMFPILFCHFFGHISLQFGLYKCIHSRRNCKKDAKLQAIDKAQKLIFRLIRPLGAVLSLILFSLTPACSIVVDLFVKHWRFFGRSAKIRVLLAQQFRPANCQCCLKTVAVITLSKNVHRPNF